MVLGNRPTRLRVLPLRLVSLRLVAPLVTVALVVTGLLGPASASDGSIAPPAPAGTALTLKAPPSADAVTWAQLTATLVRTDTGAPVPGAVVRFERRSAGAWQPLAERTTDENGVATTKATVRSAVADNVLRVVFDGSSPGGEPLQGSRSAEATIQPVVHPSTVTLAGADRVVDGRSLTLKMTWKVRDGRPVAHLADVWRSEEKGAWKKYAVVRFDAKGTAKLKITPRLDSRWKILGRAARWWAKDESNVHRVDNRPPGVPVSYPSSAPHPRVNLPRQARAVGAGPNGVVTPIPGSVWRSMVGRSWHSGCPVGRSSLRLVRINHWGYDGYRYRGELVVHSAIAPKTVGAFSDLYWKKLPVRAMYLVDRFGWSSKLGGADNYGSMAAGNTSAFNCRGVVGNPSVRSPHSYGRAIDVNTWENPYRSRTGIVPNTWWATRSHPQIAWRSSNHQVVRILRANGFRWTYSTADAHHFDG